MKIFVSTAIVLLALSAGAEEKELKRIGTGEATKHYDETCVVTGKVVQITIREKLVYVNLDKPFPDSPFTAVIFARATNEFGDLKALQGKAVELQGKIEEYKEKPQMVLNSTNQLKVITAPAPKKE
jgi:hypothetical protein